MLETILVKIIDFYSWLIIIYILMTWIPRKDSGIIEDIRAVLGSICEPYLSLFRKFIPPLGMIDFSPIIAILSLSLIISVITRLL